MILLGQPQIHHEFETRLGGRIVKFGQEQNYHYFIFLETFCHILYFLSHNMSAQTPSVSDSAGHWQFVTGTSVTQRTRQDTRRPFSID